MSVQLFVPHFRIEECLKEIKICLEKGWTGLGFKTVEFEEAWKEYTHLTHAHFLSSNTAGLHLALEVFKRRYNWSEEDEILTTSLTFISTNHAILQANLKPIFVDTDEYLCIDPQKIDAHITPKTKAVMFVGIGGNTGQLEKVIEICKKRNLKIILDAAHMSGTRHRGIHVGSNVDVTIFSFQAVKNLATADSGMICFAKKEDDELARKMSWLGINKDTYARTTVQGSYKWMYDVEEVGYKYNGNSIMAAIGLVQLKYLDQDNSYRRQLAHWYREGLSSNNKLTFVKTANDCESSQHLLQIRVKNRDELMLALHKYEIYPGVHYRDNTEYKMYEYGAKSVPLSRQASMEILSLPLHLGITKNDVTHVCKAINESLR